MNLQFRNEVPPVDQFVALFKTTGWSCDATQAEFAEALANSWYVVAAYAGERLIGAGRIVTDKVMHAMIYDLVVDPAFHGQGIGTQILDRLVTKCLEANIRDIQLFCAKGKRAFYEKRGFAARTEDAPGMQYARSRGE